MTTQMPHVANSDRFTFFMDSIKVLFPTTHEAVWAFIKQSDSLDVMHFEASHNDCEMSYGRLLEAVRGVVPRVSGSALGAAIVADVDRRLSAYVLHCEVAQAHEQGPDAEIEIWAAWERADAQQAEQDKIDMYRNEY